jgi:hypothetical protein
MKILYLSLFFVFGLFLSKQSHNYPVKLASQKDSIILKLKNKKAAVDQYLLKHDKALVVFVKIPGKKNLIRIENENWPDEIEYTYNILKNSSGKIIFVAQIPYSESGDWDIAYRHYFDEQGNTYAFNKVESIFGDVKGGVIREILLTYYDEKFKNISQVNSFTDKDYRTIKINKNKFDFHDYDYNIYKNLSDCLASYNIKIAN